MGAGRSVGAGLEELTRGGTLPALWASIWAGDPARRVLETPDAGTVTAGRLDAWTAQAARRYLAAGIAPGSRALVSGRPSLALVVAYVGALRAGLAVVPANPAYAPAELAHLLADSRPALAVLDDPNRLAGLDTAGLSVTSTSLAELPAPVEQGVRLDAAEPDAPALIVYTSGTTGRPKGAVLTHRNLLAGAHAVRLAWAWTPDDVLVLALPLFHVHGLAIGLHGTLTAGARAVVLPGFEPDAVAEAIRTYDASLFFGVPTMYHRLAAAGRLDALRPLRLVVSGSAPLAPELFAAIEAGSGHRVLERYGTSETLMIAGNPLDGDRRPGTVGFPFPGMEIRLSSRTAGSSRAAGSSTPGTPAESAYDEIEVRGPSVFAGYLGRDPADDPETFTADGWFRTGDVGAYDETGALRIVGRRKELVITGGFNVYPREVEEVVEAHPAVLEAAVVGVPSSEWGESVAAFVVTDAGETSRTLEDELDAWCRERLVAYKRPRVWRFVDALPRTALGKVERHKLCSAPGGGSATPRRPVP